MLSAIAIAISIATYHASVIDIDITGAVAIALNVADPVTMITLTNITSTSKPFGAGTSTAIITYHQREQSSSCVFLHCPLFTICSYLFPASSIWSTQL